MAVDTAQRRASAASIALAMFGPVILPDSALTQPDRQSAAMLYPGILSGEAVVVPVAAVESLGQNQGRYWYRGQLLTRAEVEREYRKRAAETRRKASEDAKRDLQPPPAPVPDAAIGSVLDALDSATKADAVDVARLMDNISSRLAALPETTTDEDAEAMYVVMAAILLDDAS